MMLANMRRALLVVVFSVITGAGSLAWADHGHGGGHGGGGGHGWSGGGHGWGGGGWNGGHGHVNYGHFGGYNGFNNYWRGGGLRYYSGYRNFGWPYNYYRNYYYRPYAYSYFGYPYLYGYYNNYFSGYYGYPSYYYSYPSDYFVNGSDYYDGGNPPPAYVVSRPVSDVARVEVRLPDPQGTLWVQDQEINSSGTVRQFRSPQLDPSQQYTYTIKAAWNDNGKVVTDERRVKVHANDLAVVDFNQQLQTAPDARRPAMPDLPPPQPRSTE
jgi:uncharacterized protein (TIGR03000 family)